jgi:hypothetical protein
VSEQEEVMNKFTVTIACCFLIFLADASPAKDWRGIVPLHSTREDVRKILGKPRSDNNLSDHYRIDNLYVNIWYATEPCSGLLYHWGNYGVSAGTVFSVGINFEEGIPLAKFKIPNMEKLKRGKPDSTFTVDYFDADEGIEYSVQDGKVVSVTYGPSTADAYLRCTEDSKGNP